MRQLSVSNPRAFLLTSAALRPAGLWALRPGYDNPLTLSVEGLSLASADRICLTVAGQATHALSRTEAHADRHPDGRVTLWWSRLEAEALHQHAGAILPFCLDIEIGGRLLRVAEGEIEVEG
jgi:hypothetical protein